MEKGRKVLVFGQLTEMERERDDWGRNIEPAGRFCLVSKTRQSFVDVL